MLFGKINKTGEKNVEKWNLKTPLRVLEQWVYWRCRQLEKLIFHGIWICHCHEVRELRVLQWMLLKVLLPWTIQCLWSNRPENSMSILKLCSHVTLSMFNASSTSFNDHKQSKYKDYFLYVWFVWKKKCVLCIASYVWRKFLSIQI